MSLVAVAALSSLSDLPFDRSAYLLRVERLLDRYRTAMVLRDAESSAKRRPLLRLLRAHPTSLLEVERAPERLEARHSLVEMEHSLVRAGAPLPAPADQPDRCRVLALADSEVWLIGFKVLDHDARRPAKGALAIGLDQLGVPVDGLRPVLAAYQSLRKSQRHRAVLEASAARHHIDGLVDWLLPPAAVRGFVKVGPADSIVEGRSRRFDVNGHQVAVFRDRGRLLAIDDVCPHRGGPLGKGDLEDGCVVCPLHGWTFDLETGRMKGSPGVRVPTYAIEVVDGELAIGPPKK